MNHNFIFIALFILTLLCNAQEKLSSLSQKPNIILIMADDQGWGDTDYNGHKTIKTPNLDQMATQAFILDRFYAASPVCSPTRASVFTGRNPIRSKVTNHGRYMRPHEHTLAEILKIEGYITGLFGKFHLGSGQPNSDCNPSAMGFDEWCIGLNFFDNNPYLSRNGSVEQRKGQGSILTIDDTIQFLKKHHKSTQPILAVAWFPSPHKPHKESRSNSQLYVGNKNKPYFDEISLLDNQLGRLRQELKSLKMAENTILWYCSDNGGLLKESSGGREKKGSIYEGGLRVPAIVEWPKQKLQGRSSVPMHTSDMLPTLLAMAGIEKTFIHPLDGVDMSGVFDGSLNKRNSPMGFWHNFQKGESTFSDKFLKQIMLKQQSKEPTPHNLHRISKDVHKFPKFDKNNHTGHSAWNDWPWKLHRIEGEKYELYNLLDDPMETTDLSKKPIHAARFLKMKNEIQQWMRSVIGSLNGEDY
ncbi:MAG: sulfatase-like hydrolase/transferase [Lentisphaeraceae bacterium]|nr:sulfatase-like hydrolase/transferase [Lentisphaeraceae bacterium]